MVRMTVMIAAAITGLSLLIAPTAHAQSACGDQVTVASGDTLYSIAQHCGTSVMAIMNANPGITNPNVIYVGQTISMPGADGDQSGRNGNQTTYTIRPGDTLYSVAARNGTSVANMVQANPGITDPARIYVGQQIVIPSGSQAPVFTRVNVFLIATGDGDVGCGDRLVAVSRPIAASQAPLTASIRELLSIKEQQYGQSGLYNALYQSDLTLDQVQLEQGSATIRLSGNLQLGGTCDAPRVEAQLSQTARQFVTVDRVNIFVNGRTLQDVLSQR